MFSFPSSESRRCFADSEPFPTATAHSGHRRACSTSPAYGSAIWRLPEGLSPCTDRDRGSRSRHCNGINLILDQKGETFFINLIRRDGDAGDETGSVGQWVQRPGGDSDIQGGALCMYCVPACAPRFGDRPPAFPDSRPKIASQIFSRSKSMSDGVVVTTKSGMYSIR